MKTAAQDLADHHSQMDQSLLTKLLSQLNKLVKEVNRITSLIITDIIEEFINCICRSTLSIPVLLLARADPKALSKNSLPTGFRSKLESMP